MVITGLANEASNSASRSSSLSLLGLRPVVGYHQTLVLVVLKQLGNQIIGA